MEVQPHVLYLLLGFAFISGIISSVAASPAIIMLPFMMLTGLPTHLVLGTQKFYNTASLLTSSVYYYRKNLFNLRFWLAALVAASIGATLGVILTQFLSAGDLRKVLAPLIGTVAVYLLFSQQIKRWVNIDLSRSKARSKWVMVLGASLGLYSGFVGAGSGTIWSALTSALFNVDAQEANALSCAFTFMTNFTALLIFIIFNEVNYPLGILLSLFGIIGALIGAKLALEKGAQFIRYALVTVTVSMSIYLALS